MIWKNIKYRSTNFQKKILGGAPLPRPLPAKSRASPSIRGSPSILKRFAPFIRASLILPQPQLPGYATEFLTHLFKLCHIYILFVTHLYKLWHTYIQIIQNLHKLCHTYIAIYVLFI